MEASSDNAGERAYRAAIKHHDRDVADQNRREREHERRRKTEKIKLAQELKRVTTCLSKGVYRCTGIELGKQGGHPVLVAAYLSWSCCYFRLTTLKHYFISFM